MLNRKFSLREIILMLVAVVLALGIFYYQVILKNYNNAKTQYDTSALQDEQTILLTKVSKLKSMQDYLDEHKDDNNGKVEKYNNLANEMDALASVFNGRVDNVSIDWEDPSVNDSIVRRNATISFKTNGYSLAEQLVKDIADLKYRCIITNLSMSDDNSENLNSTSSVSITMNVTFYETIEGVNDTSGLVIEDSSEEN